MFSVSRCNSKQIVCERPEGTMYSTVLDKMQMMSKDVMLLSKANFSR